MTSCTEIETAPPTPAPAVLPPSTEVPRRKARGFNPVAAAMRAATLAGSKVAFEVLMRAHLPTARRVHRWWRHQTFAYPRWCGMPRFRRTIDLPWGARFACDSADYIEERLLFTGKWEAHVSAIIRRILRRGDVFVDVGANVGYHSLLAADAVGEEGRVIAFEPSLSNYDRFLANVRRNRLKNVIPVSLGLSDGTAMFRMFEGEEGNAGAMTMRGGSAPLHDALTVPLDAILPADVAGRVRLVKIDIEGLELMALRGMRRLLEGERAPFVLVEITPDFLRAVGGSASELVDFMLGRGYRLLVARRVGPEEFSWQPAEGHGDLPGHGIDGCFVPKWADPADYAEADKARH